MHETILESLGVVVLVRKGPSEFSLPNSWPDWFSEILKTGTTDQGSISFTDDLSFIGIYLDEAKEHWAKKVSYPKSFPLWDVSSSEGQTHTLEVSALSDKQGEYLLIRPRIELEERRIIQGARENLLNQEKLLSYISSLEGEAENNLEILEGFPDLVLKVHSNGKLSKLISSKSDSPSPDSLFTLIPKRLEKDLKSALEKEWGNSLFEYTRDEKDFELRIIPLKADELLAVERDVSKKKKLERELLQAKIIADEANKAKSAFLAKASHEIRTPMSGVIGMANILLLSELNNEQREQVSIINQSAESLVNLINDLLDHSKIEAGKFEILESQFDLVDVANSVTKLLFPKAEALGVNCSLVVSKDLNTEVLTDKNRVRQVLTNLLGNAIKFTQSGEIVVSLAPDSDTQAVVVSVSDTGSGIPENKKAEVFEEYSQLKSNPEFSIGTGLGLPICKKLVEMLGGEIGLESKLGQGSTFWFSIPRNSLTTRSSQSSPNKELGSYSGAVLVVEDNIVNQKVASGILQKCGFTVEVADTGEKALRLLKENNYSLIFIDCNLPGMSGFDLAKQVRESGAQHKIIAMTADAFKANKEKCLAMGMDDFLAKPFGIKDLNEILERVL